MKYNLNITDQGEYIFSPIISTEPDVYVFDKKDIVEGVVSDEVALNNRTFLNDAIKYAKENGFSKFNFNGLDAYFNVLGTDKYNKITTHNTAIQLLSDTEYLLGTLRVQPNGWKANALISTFNQDNIKIIGGALLGDKNEHDYSKSGVFDWSHLIHIVGTHNILVEGVLIKDAVSDGFYCRNTKLRRASDGALINGNRTTKNAVIRGNVFDGNGRNNLSPVDGDGIIIENNVIKNAGVNGTLPKCGIDLESYRERNSETGVLSEWQRIENVIIRNNTFFGNENTDLLLYTTNNVEVYGNTFTKGISNTAAFDIKIHDNTFVAEDGFTGNAITVNEFIVDATGEELNVNWDIYNNSITGYSKGIAVAGVNITVYNNDIINCINDGIILKRLVNGIFYNNTVNSNVAGSVGISNFGSSQSINGVTITNDYYNVLGDALELRGLDGSAGILHIITTEFIGNQDIDIRNSNDVTIDNCTYTTIHQKNNTNITII